MIGTRDTENFISAQQERWNTEDRPKVEALIRPASDPNRSAKYNVQFTNHGVEEAIDIQAKIAGTDLAHTLVTKLFLEDPYQVPNLRTGAQQWVTTVVENNQDFLVVCVEYKNGQGLRFADPPTFYATPLVWLKSEGDLHSERERGGPRPVTPVEDAELSEGFSCAAL